jgi:DNA-binding response OmpR family regulator
VNGLSGSEYDGEQMTVSRGRVLVIDDNPQLLRLVSVFLNMEGYEVFTTGDAEAGIRVADSASPDLVVLDLLMPGVDGYEVCRRLKAQCPRLAVVAVTDAGCDDRRNAARLAGADHVLSKPFRLAYLERVINGLARTSLRETASRVS